MGNKAGVTQTPGNKMLGMQFGGTMTMKRQIIARDSRMMARALLLAGTALVLSGCGNWPYDRQLTSAVVAQPVPLDGYQYTLAEDVPLSRAFVALPYLAGQPIGARETRYANGIEQIIVLQSQATSDGENNIEIRAVQDGKSDNRVVDQHLKIRSTDSASIKKELRDYVWGTPMSIVPTIESNAYGAFGYALGNRSNGYRCMYGWQTIKGEEKRKNLFGVFKSTTTNLSVRVRLCRSDLSETQMVDIMRGLRVTMNPDALEIQPKMHWRNEGYGISSSATPGTAVPGYITEGLSPVTSAPIAAAPVVEGTIPAQPVIETPRPARTTSKPTLFKTKPKAAPVQSVADPDRVVDPKTKRVTIFVDPRDYAAVPLPGDIANAPQIQRQGTQSPFAVPGSAGGAVVPSADAGGLQSDAARENRKQAVRQISGVTSVPGPGWNAPASSGGGFGGGYGSDTRDLFLAPERDGYQGVDLEKLRKDQAEGTNVKHNLWLNDKARNDNDGLPLQRPCELIRDADCAAQNAANRAAISSLRDR